MSNNNEKTASVNVNGRDAQGSKKHQGIDPRGVFEQMLKGDFDPTKVEAIDLVFGHREFKGQKRILSVIDLGGGDKADTYPLVCRFKPTLGRTIPSFVFFRKKDVPRRSGGIQKRITGFAMPRNLRDAQRRGEWAGIGNNLLELKFEPSRDEKGGWIATGPNGKIVILPKDSGVEPEVGKVETYMVSEHMGHFIAHCKVEKAAQEDKKKLDADVKEMALVLQAETVDTYGFVIGGRLYDACEIMDLPATATEKEVRARHRQLAANEHPDKKANEYRKLTGSEPIAADRQDWNFEFQLIERAYQRMMIIRKRIAMSQRFFRLGKEAKPELSVQLAVYELAKIAGHNTNFLKKVFNRVGYPGVLAETQVSRPIAWVVLGAIAGGKIDDLEPTALEAEEPEQEAAAEPTPVPPPAQVKAEASDGFTNRPRMSASK